MISGRLPGHNSRACRCRFAPIRHGVFPTSLLSICRPIRRGNRCQQRTLERSWNVRTGIEKTSGRLVFADDHFLQRDVLPEKLRKAGVIFQPLERAMIEHEDLFRRHFMSQPATLGSAKFAALHEAFVRSGTFLYLPAGVEVELPLETFHWLHARKHRNFPAHPCRGGQDARR